jgi:SRSO17 transposase
MVGRAIKKPQTQQNQEGIEGNAITVVIDETGDRKKVKD